LKSFVTLLFLALIVGIVIGGGIGYQYGLSNAWPVADAMAAQTKVDQEFFEARFSNTGELVEMCRDFVLNAVDLVISAPN